MQVEKIIITKQLMDIDESKPYEELIVDGLDKIINEDDLSNYSTTAIRIPYKIVPFSINDRVKKYYLIRINQNEIFDELSNLTSNDINDLVEKRTKEWRTIVENEKFLSKINTKEGIKRLSPWKRLFNKF